MKMADIKGTVYSIMKNTPAESNIPKVRVKRSNKGIPHTDSMTGVFNTWIVKHPLTEYTKYPYADVTTRYLDKMVRRHNNRANYLLDRVGRMIKRVDVLGK